MTFLISKVDTKEKTFTSMDSPAESPFCHAERVVSADTTDLPRSKSFLVTNKTNKHYLSLNMHLEYK